MSRRGSWNTVYASLLPEHADAEFSPDSDPAYDLDVDRVARYERSTLHLLRDTDVERMLDADDLIEGLFPVRSLVVLYSFPGRGKTYLGLDWGFSVVTGQPWLGRRIVTPGPALYVASEGAWTLKPRIRAWKHAHGISGRGTDLRFCTEPVNLLQNVDVLVRTVKEAGFRLVIIDTLAASMIGGDEDSARDMSIVVAAASQLREAGATVLLLHHTGKSDKVERGSVALRGAADTVMKLRGEGSDITLVCEKQRNGEPFESIALRLRTVQPGGGKPSCVIEEPTASLVDADSSLPTWAPRMLQTLREHRELSTGRFEDLSNTPRQTFHRRLRDLKARGLVESVRVGRETLNRLTPRGLEEAEA